MNNLVKILIAAGLGAVAFVLNLIILNSGPKPSSFAVAAKAISRDHKIGDADVSSVPVPGDPAELSKTFIPFTSEGMGQILGVSATRDYQAGDPILRRDLPTSAPPVDVLGPFRLLSVGEELIADSDGAAHGNGRDNTVTVAAKVRQTASKVKGGSGRFEFEDPMTLKLLQIVDALRNQRLGGRDSRLRIVSVVLLPKAGSPADGLTLSTATDDLADPTINQATNIVESQSLDALGLQADEVAVIVPLTGVEILPAILMRGNQVGFVTPAYQ
jgi:hypothetical protein